MLKWGRAGDFKHGVCGNMKMLTWWQHSSSPLFRQPSASLFTSWYLPLSFCHCPHQSTSDPQPLCVGDPFRSARNWSSIALCLQMGLSSLLSSSLSLSRALCCIHGSKFSDFPNENIVILWLYDGGFFAFYFMSGQLCLLWILGLAPGFMWCRVGGRYHSIVQLASCVWPTPAIKPSVQVLGT